MSLIEDMLVQAAVYWPPGSEETAGADYDEYGHRLYATPVQVDCRWEDSNQEFIGADGTRQLSRAIVYTGQDVSVGGVLWLGDIGDVQYPDDPKKNDGAWEIKRFDKLPDIDAEEFLRTAYL